MKPKYFLVILLVTIFISCKKDNVTSSTVVNLTTCTYKMFNIESICFDSVLEDSRCPKNVMCVWTGFAVVKLTLSANGIKYPFTLATLPIGNYSPEATITGYKIKLLNLLPYPDASSLPIPTAEIKAELEITKQ